MMLPVVTIQVLLCPRQDPSTSHTAAIEAASSQQGALTVVLQVQVKSTFKSLIQKLQVATDIDMDGMSVAFLQRDGPSQRTQLFEKSVSPHEVLRPEGQVYAVYHISKVRHSILHFIFMRDMFLKAGFPTWQTCHEVCPTSNTAFWRLQEAADRQYEILKTYGIEGHVILALDGSGYTCVLCEAKKVPGFHSWKKFDAGMNRD
jgi:hypothetical protein